MWGYGALAIYPAPPGSRADRLPDAAGRIGRCGGPVCPVGRARLPLHDRSAGGIAGRRAPGLRRPSLDRACGHRCGLRVHDASIARAVVQGSWPAARPCPPGTRPPARPRAPGRASWNSPKPSWRRSPRTEAATRDLFIARSRVRTPCRPSLPWQTCWPSRRQREVQGLRTRPTPAPAADHLVRQAARSGRCSRRPGRAQAVGDAQCAWTKWWLLRSSSFGNWPTARGSTSARQRPCHIARPTTCACSRSSATW